MENPKSKLYKVFSKATGLVKKQKLSTLILVTFVSEIFLVVIAQVFSSSKVNLVERLEEEASRMGERRQFHSGKIYKAVGHRSVEYLEVV